MQDALASTMILVMDDFGKLHLGCTYTFLTLHTAHHGYVPNCTIALRQCQWHPSGTFTDFGYEFD